MDTWTDRKFSKRKFQSKGMKSYHAHIKQIILESTVLEFTWLVTDGFMGEYGLVPPPQKRKLGPPNTWDPQEIWNIPRLIFSFLLKICIHYFPTGSFQVPTKKNHPHNLSHSYMNVLKNGSAHPPPSHSSPWRGGGVQAMKFHLHLAYS